MKKTFCILLELVLVFGICFGSVYALDEQEEQIQEEYTIEKNYDDSFENADISDDIALRSGGCGSYQVYKRGSSRCTNTYCPGGFVRKRMRQDHERRKCVNNENIVYYDYRVKNVFIACDC